MAAAMIMLLPMTISVGTTIVNLSYTTVKTVVYVASCIYDYYKKPVQAIKDRPYDEKSNEFQVIDRRTATAKVHIILDDILPNPDLFFSDPPKNVPVYL